MSRRLMRTLLLGGFGFLLLLCTAGQARGQVSRTLDVGEMEYSTNEGFTSDDISWPRDNNAATLLEVYGIIVGVDLDWTDENGVQHTRKVAQVAQHKYTDLENVVVPQEFVRTYRNPYPTKMVDEQNFTPPLSAQDPVDPNLPADAVIYTRASTWTGIQIERWAYAFAYDKYDDFVILEYVFTNTLEEPRQNVYFGLTAETSADEFYPGDVWGNYYGASYRHYAAGDPTADSMRVWYSWDADSKADTEDTKGNPDSQWGNFNEPHYMSFAVAHVDRGPGDTRDAPAQPRKAGWSQRELSPNLNEQSHEDLYQFLVQGWSPQNPSTYAKTVNANGEEVRRGNYRVLRPGVDVRELDAEDEQEKTALMSFGPYDLEPGEDVRIVTVFAGGTIPERLAIDAGRAYENGYSGQIRMRPLPPNRNIRVHGHHIVRDGDVYNLQGERLAQAGQMLTKDQKDAIIDQIGKGLALENAWRASKVWNEGDVRSGEGRFDIPLAPAAPSISGLSAPDQVALEWGDEAAMDTRAGPIAGYRIYRNYDRPPSITSPTDTSFVLVAEVGPDQRTYVDDGVVRGDDYYYYIAAVTETGIEGSSFLNRTGTTAEPEREALTPQSPPSETWQEDVIVVPNPYHVQAAQKYPGRRLNFLNLPAYADIYIYTVAGDLVQTIHHDAPAGTGNKDWEEQRTFSTMEIVSGIYIYVVEELDGPNGNPTGKTAMGKFVVIK